MIKIAFFFIYELLVLITLICVLITVALYTLVERKIMANIQRRQGPNVVGFWGLLQPLADGGKLAFKYKITPKQANQVLFSFSPVVILFTSLFSWFLVIQGHITTKNNFLLAALMEPELILPIDSWIYSFVNLLPKVNDFRGVLHFTNEFAGYFLEADYLFFSLFRDFHWDYHISTNFIQSSNVLFPIAVNFNWLNDLHQSMIHEFQRFSWTEFQESFFNSIYIWIQTKNTISTSILCILAISSLNVYALILAGWASNSKYAFFGSLRSGAQMISYEVAVGLTLLPVLLIAGCSLNFKTLLELNNIVYHWNLWFFSVCFLIFVVSMLAETNRTPFDLTEAEAELVAGYNVEYASLIFAMFFLAEYSNMLIMSIVGTIFYLGSFYTFLFLFQIFCFVYFFVLVRATFPRYKYNDLMNIGWKNFLPILLGFFVYVGFGTFWTDAQYYGV